jgi:hypothetical protein
MSTLGILAAVLVPCVCLLSNRIASGILALQRPAVMSGLLTVAGIGIVVGSVVRFEIADEKATDDSMGELDIYDSTTPSFVTSRATATTDRGTTLVLMEPTTIQTWDWAAREAKILGSTRLINDVIRRGSAGEYSNCHGWVFAGGKFRLSPEDVQLILNENGYREVSEPQPGDVVVYRQNGDIAHTAVVRYVTAGQPVMVESKWGALGILLHPTDKSLYGAKFTFYRSPRLGHLLAGLGDQPAPSNNIRRTVATE